MQNTVLFVDDQEEILFLIKRMLKDESYTMLFAKSGQEALELIQENPVDVVVTDIIMPGISGLELLDVIKQSHPRIVRIVLSGFSHIPTLLSAINHGKIYRYITKPWHVDEEAKQIIRDALEYSRLLNAQNTDTGISLNAVLKFLKVIEAVPTVYIVTESGKTVYVHPALVDTYKINEIPDLEEGQNSIYAVSQLSKEVSVIVFK